MSGRIVDLRRAAAPFAVDEGVLTATKMTAVVTHRSESRPVEDALCAYVVDEGRDEAAREDMRKPRRIARSPGAERPRRRALDGAAASETRAAISTRDPDDDYLLALRLSQGRRTRFA